MMPSQLPSTNYHPPLVVIVGPTASGKTDLAIKVAKQSNGEIICADSRTVFREMDIGTAKPDEQERQGIVHWGLDLRKPGERFTAAEFQAYAGATIDDIRSRGKLPIVVGGTGLYVDGLIFDYDFPDQPTQSQRKLLDKMSADDLYKYCIDNNMAIPLNDKNKRHLISAAIRGNREDVRKFKPMSGVFVVGIATDKQILRKNIATRTEHMFESGVVDEASMLGKKYGWDSEAMTGNIYPIMRQYLDGEATMDQAKQAFRDRDWQLAKRQMTWFRRNPFILWTSKEEGEQIIQSHLSTGCQGCGKI